MKIVLLGKDTDERLGIYKYLGSRGHEVFVTDERLTAESLGTFDIGVSWFYKHIIRQPELDAVPLGIVNCHPGFLPWGRGAMPNVWALADNFPAGVSMHYMSAKVDEGDVICQLEVAKDPTDTGQTLYAKLLTAQYHLFMSFWPAIEALGIAGLRVPTLPQPQAPTGFGMSYRTHRSKDVAEIDDLGKLMGHSYVRRFINILRARTFPPHEAAYFTDEKGDRYYVRVSIEKAPAVSDR